MALNKQPLNISFGQGVDTKTDPWKVPPGKMLALSNSIFGVGGLMSKRNGFGQITGLSDLTVNKLTTFTGSLTAIGSNLYNYAPETATWYNKGTITSVQTATIPMVRSADSQTRQDAAVTSEGLVCAVFLDSDGTNKYQVIDESSSQVVVAATSLPSTATVARVFVLGRYFIITFLATVSAASHLQYIAIPVLTPSVPGAATDIATNAASLSAGYDGVVANNALYIAYSATGTTIKFTYLDQTLVQHGVTSIAAHQSIRMSVAADNSTPTPVIWVTFVENGGTSMYTASFSSTGTAILAATQILTGISTNNVTSVVTAGTVLIFAAKQVQYSYGSVADSYNVITHTCTSAGVVVNNISTIRSVTLASKAFYVNSVPYIMVTYDGTVGNPGNNYQPTYFLMGSTGNIVAKLAYSNGGGYPTTQLLPSGNVSGSDVKIAYLFKDLLTPVNKSQGVANTAGIYSQTGVNLVTWTISDTPMVSSEIGHNLHFAGGILWMYDGAKPVEHGFHVYPEDIGITTATGSGDLVAQQYYYQATYEWTDAQGSIHRSAPSVPVGQVTTTASSTNTVKIPTLRLTAKTGANKVRIVIYRWSTAQPNYYQLTSVASPILNDTTIDSITYVDTAADSAILGNRLIYTTGGVVENIAAPACTDLTLFKSRLFYIDAEDTNVIGYSKQVIQNTPVETSDLFTIYVAPNISSQEGTGGNTVLSGMDDKLIIFKQGAMNYVTGNGPDITGANNDFSDPTYISSTVGCDNPNSLVFIPQGLMFQSEKGIWLLNRDLSTSYIGAPVEQYNSAAVLSAVNVPNTNQVRFTLDNGITLMYDYYYDQWGTFVNIPAESSTVFQSRHTYVNSSGQVFQETPGLYLDGSNPVLMSFQTGWFNLAGLQGYERAYFFYILGTYLSPHKLKVDIAYDYNSAPSQSVMVNPDNFNAAYGGDTIYGQAGAFGGNSSVEQWRIFMQQQKCQAFQITMTEIYDPSKGVAAGAGLTLSGLNLIVGLKKGYTTLKPARSVG